MRRGVWLGALALVGAINLQADAQPLVWKRVERPDASQPQATVRGSSGTTTSASLDRPIASADGGYPQPRSFPDEYRGAVLIGRSAGYQVDQIPAVAAPGTIIAVGGSAPPLTPTPTRMGSTEQAETYSSGDQFASDRGQIPAPPGLRQTGGELPMPGKVPAPPPTSPVGNWLETYPVTPPPPVAGFPDPGVETAQGFRPRFYARGEYLLWWTKHDSTPPLVTTGSATSLPAPRFDGALGNPDTVVLFGGDLQRNPFSGGRLTVGAALDECGDKYFEVTGFFLGPQSANFSASSSQFPLLARPFFAANSGLVGFPGEFRELVTSPGLAVGNISVRAPSRLWGVEPNLICNWCEGCDYRIDVLAGARYLNLQEGITVVEDLLPSAAAGSPFTGSRFQVTDRFATSNQFYGGQVGVRGTYLFDRFSLTGDVKVALGETHEQTTVNGFFSLPAGVVNPDPRPGGLLATQSNIGNFSKDRFAVVPEVGVRLGYDLTQNIKLSVGYNFLYWSSVMRPGDQIDRNLDVLQVPNFVPAGAAVTPVVPARPMPLLKETDYWAQGLTFGVEFRY